VGDISLSKAVRSNLLSLQNTSAMMNKTQDRLATGNKVNSALDNPTNFFTAASLNSRAGDLNLLMDSMANGIQTLEAADNGLTAITKTLESMQSTLRQARQDKSFQTQSFAIPTAGAAVALSGGALDGDVTVGAGATDVIAVDSDDVVGGSFTITVGNVSAQISTVAAVDDDPDTSDINETVAATTGQGIADQINNNEALKKAGISATVDEDGKFQIVNATGKEATLTNTVAGSDVLAGIGLKAGQTIDATGDVAVTDVNALVRLINNGDDTKGKVRASNDNGSLRIENLSTTDLSATVGAEASTIKGNAVRDDLSTQYNELRDQLDKLADDASFNGINLLRGDKLTITFNETGTSSIDIQTKDQDQVNSASLGISTTLSGADLDSDTNIDAELAKLKTALSNVRSQSSAFGSNLSVVQNRQDFTKATINTLQTGAANLTLADMNEEAANLLALQTRQSLSSNSLSLASQADQSILQLIR
jgi:flagellin-like hook-associated protein FlgL